MFTKIPGRSFFYPAIISICIVSFSLFSAPETSSESSFTSLKSHTAQFYDAETMAVLLQWIKMINQMKKVDKAEKLFAVNDFFNKQIQFSSDLKIWKQKDYWATPLETMAKRQGDCEDFSLAKYISLILSGISRENLRLVYVQAKRGGAHAKPVAHMVLAYYSKPDADPLILDNLVPGITPASSRKDLVPIFSFNASSLWVTGKNKTYDSQRRLSKWQDVLKRIKKEGFFDANP